ncbi:MAG: YicC/YloC family endoribonuclease [Cetobacterium somerae]|uniref:TIGR00255 family protein n=1 Tax=Cetobacterium somerae ATCC BAA-474 TaxID=1319815 RepID=U7VBF5_9FUSO|nr:MULTISPECIES: YicC/YloC family endoribonuclease [Cetobacterium]ERT68123.1 TIGR00255 family protein [Cetobacterium somerae ATCC BAA-474]MBC2852775.1 YicC family protein [Cetobacterium sp. 2G large]MCQ9628008.1 YicC family protein [Cetobacterium somerae]WVJ00959.1 YicC/YloC family endoribonuclease [Cetobacterium somerae]
MRSMTGYSKEYFENEKYAISLEIKSVNNKNLNLKIKSPHMLNFLENKIRTEVASRVTRGSIDLKIEFQDKREVDNLFEYDKNMTASYLKVLNAIEHEYEEKFSNKLDLLVKNLNVIRRNDLEIDEKEYENFIVKNLHLLLDSFVEMKEAEGARMKDYFLQCIAIIENNVNEIKKLKENIVINYKEKLLERLSKISNIEFNDETLLREVLLFTDKSDISEEVSRLESHLIQLKIELDSPNAGVGKKIDFILQEIFRELNTSGVKCNLYDISKLIVECKNEIEKIREQALNIE